MGRVKPEQGPSKPRQWARTQLTQAAQPESCDLQMQTQLFLFWVLCCDTELPQWPQVRPNSMSCPPTKWLTRCQPLSYHLISIKVNFPTTYNYLCKYVNNAIRHLGHLVLGMHCFVLYILYILYNKIYRLGVYSHLLKWVDFFLICYFFINIWAPTVCCVYHGWQN